MPARRTRTRNPRPRRPSASSASRPSILRALRHPNYRLFFGGQSISLVGTWVTRVAQSWLVYRLTGSAAMLGVVAFVGQVPTFVLSPFAGVWVDRLDRYRVLLVAQVLAMLQSFALAALALTGAIEIWHVLALGAFQGVVNAFDTPARQAFLVEMVEDRADLPNAIALNSSMVNGARLVGPSIAGVVIAAVGEGWCFLADGISYVAVIGSLLAMKVARRPVERSGKRVLQELADGFRYAFGFAPIRALLLLLALVGLLGMPYTVLMPVVADRTLGGGAHTLGFLMGATGVGALGGALYLASRRSVLGLGKVIALSAALYGAALIAFGLSRSVALSMLILPLAGAGFMVQMAASNTVIQTVVREEMRGRVMAFYTMAIMGTAPFGSLLAGAVAARIGAPETIMIGGAACFACAVLFARTLPKLRKLMRPVYAERGILPPLSAGLSDADLQRGGMER